MVAILDFIFDDGVQELDKYRYNVKLTDTDTRKVFDDKLKFLYLEMPKFNKGIEELDSHFGKWMYVLKHSHILERIPAALQEQIFNKAFTVAEVANLSSEEVGAYENGLKDY